MSTETKVLLSWPCLKSQTPGLPVRVLMGDSACGGGAFPVKTSLSKSAGFLPSLSLPRTGDC